jgi:hypothetical protein
LRALIPILFILAACTPPAEQGYPPAYELNFMRGCEAQGAPRAVCACSWARVAAEVPRAELDRLERTPAAARPDDPVQKQLEGFALQCTTEHAQTTSTP